MRYSLKKIILYGMFNRTQLKINALGQHYILQLYCNLWDYFPRHILYFIIRLFSIGGIS